MSREGPDITWAPKKAKSTRSRLFNDDEGEEQDGVCAPTAMGGLEGGVLGANGSVVEGSPSRRSLLDSFDQAVQPAPATPPRVQTALALTQAAGLKRREPDRASSLAVSTAAVPVPTDEEPAFSFKRQKSGPSPSSIAKAAAEAEGIVEGSSSSSAADAALAVAGQAQVEEEEEEEESQAAPGGSVRVVKKTALAEHGLGAKKHHHQQPAAEGDGTEEDEEDEDGQGGAAATSAGSAVDSPRASLLRLSMR